MRPEKSKTVRDFSRMVLFDSTPPPTGGSVCVLADRDDTLPTHHTGTPEVRHRFLPPPQISSSFRRKDHIDVLVFVVRYIVMDATVQATKESSRSRYCSAEETKQTYQRCQSSAVDSSVFQ